MAARPRSLRVAGVPDAPVMAEHQQGPAESVGIAIFFCDSLTENRHSRVHRGMARGHCLLHLEEESEFRQFSFVNR
jgi:hypothetical protein